MKLLLIIDDITLLSKLDNDGEIYRYGAIQIKLIIYKSPNDLIEIKDIVEKERFHLALTAVNLMVHTFSQKTWQMLLIIT